MVVHAVTFKLLLEKEFLDHVASYIERTAPRFMGLGVVSWFGRGFVRDWAWLRTCNLARISLRMKALPDAGLGIQAPMRQ